MNKALIFSTNFDVGISIQKVILLRGPIFWFCEAFLLEKKSLFFLNFFLNFFFEPLVFVKIIKALTLWCLHQPLRDVVFDLLHGEKSSVLQGRNWVIENWKGWSVLSWCFFKIKVGWLTPSVFKPEMLTKSAFYFYSCYFNKKYFLKKILHFR